MLKKQTIWLLTMLSLMIVLSAYYLISDKEDLAFIQTENPTNETIKDDAADVGNVEIDDVNEVGQNELFTMIRMELEDKRNMKKDRLKEVVASSSATTAEINEALEEMDAIEKTSSKESILQETILSGSEQYEDVLVRAEDDVVHVHVIANELPKTEAVQIMKMVQDELGDIEVDVRYQPAQD